MSTITPYQTSTAYALGRFLGLAQMASDELTWRLSPADIVETLKRIASEYEAEQRARGN